jgi:hypothetical protein
MDPENPTPNQPDDQATPQLTAPAEPEPKHATSTETNQDDPTGTPTPEADPLDTVTAQRDALAVQVQRLTVAASKGVPVDLLTADTTEALNAQADQLLAFAAGRRSPVPDPSQGARKPPQPEPVADPVRQALGR